MAIFYGDLNADDTAGCGVGLAWEIHPTFRSVWVLAFPEMVVWLSEF